MKQLSKLLALFQLVAIFVTVFAFSVPQNTIAAAAADCSSGKNLNQAALDAQKQAGIDVSAVIHHNNASSTLAEVDKTKLEALADTAVKSLNSFQGTLAPFVTADCGESAYNTYYNSLKTASDEYNKLVGVYADAGLTVRLQPFNLLANPGYAAAKSNPKILKCQQLLGELDRLSKLANVSVSGAEVQYQNTTDPLNPGSVDISSTAYKAFQAKLAEAKTAGCDVETTSKDRFAALTTEGSDLSLRNVNVQARAKGEIPGCNSVCPKTTALNLFGTGAILSGLCCLLAEFVRAMGEFAGTQGTRFLDAIERLRTLRAVIFQASPNFQLWDYFRNFVNYGLLVVLIGASFTSVLRISVDTYSVKKVLPGLAMGFIMANLSIYIARVFIDIAQVLTNTFDVLLSNATGAKTISEIIGTQFVPVVVSLAVVGGTTGSIFVPFTGGASTAAGIVFSLIIGILILAFPVLILMGLWLLFTARFYVIQFLVFVSPLAFLCLGIPGAQKYFQMWWKYFTSWIFMQPIAYFFLGLAGIILTTHAGGDTPVGQIVTFAVASTALIAALILPFRAGGAIAAGLAKYGGKGLGLALNKTRTGLRDRGNSMATSENKVWAGLGRGLSGTMSLPETIQMARKQNEERSARSGIGHAAGMLTPRIMPNSSEIQLLVQQKEMSEQKSKIEGLPLEKLAELLAKATNPLERAAILLKASADGQRHNLYKAFNKLVDPDRQIKGDPRKQKLQEARLLGATIKQTVKDGKKYDVVEGDLAGRIGGQIDELDRSKGIIKNAFRQEYVPGVGNTIIDEEENIGRGAGMFASDPAMIGRAMKGKAIGYETADGRNVVHGSLAHSIAKGSINRENFSYLKRVDADGLNYVHDNWKDVEPQMMLDFESGLKQKIADLKEKGQSDEQIKLYTDEAKAVMSAFNTRLRPQAAAVGGFGSGFDDAQRMLRPAHSPAPAPSPTLYMGGGGRSTGGIILPTAAEVDQLNNPAADVRKLIR